MIAAMNMIDSPITKEALKKKLQSLNNFDLKGLTLRSNPARNDLNRYVYLETGADEQWTRKEINPTTYN